MMQLVGQGERDYMDIKTRLINGRRDTLNSAPLGSSEFAKITWLLCDRTWASSKFNPHSHHRLPANLNFRTPPPGVDLPQ
jgi:hypothetical protein